MPSGNWDFTAHTGDQHLRLRDHGNELVVGLVLQYANEQRWKTPRAEKWRPVIARMLDRILASANPDGMLYNEVDTATLKPIGDGLSDNWGYVYGAIYTFYQCTGETRYRDAVLSVLRNLPKYRRYVWEPRADGSAAAARLVRWLRRQHRERALPRRARARARSARLDRVRDAGDARHAAAGRPHRVLVRRGQLQSHAPCSTR